MSQQYLNTTQSTKRSTWGEVDEETTIDAQIPAAIKLAVTEEMGEISSQLEKIDKALVNLVYVKQRIEVVINSIQFTGERLDALVTKVLPALSSHMMQIAESLAHKTLQIDVYRRKWNIVIHGLNGPNWPGRRRMSLRPNVSAFHWPSSRGTSCWWGPNNCEAISKRLRFRLTCRPPFDQRTIWCWHVVSWRPISSLYLVCPTFCNVPLWNSGLVDNLQQDPRKP